MLSDPAQAEDATHDGALLAYGDSKGNVGQEAVQLADAFCTQARERIEKLFESLFGANDDKLYKLAMSVLKGEHEWLEEGIVDEAYYHESLPQAAERLERRETAGVA